MVDGVSLAPQQNMVANFKSALAQITR